MARSTTDKINTVLTQNTFWFQTRSFAEKSETDITVLKETLLVVRNNVQTKASVKG